MKSANVWVISHLCAMAIGALLVIAGLAIMGAAN